MNKEIGPWWRSLRRSARQAATMLLDAIFPIECLGCGLDGEWLCPGCLGKIKLNSQDVCPICRKKSPYGTKHPWCPGALDGIFVAAELSGEILPKAIKTFKYRLARDLSRPLAEVMIGKMRRELDREDNFNQARIFFGLATKDGSFEPREIEEKKLIVVPVPLHWRKKNKRGFNQAELLAQKISCYFGLDMKTDLLKRIKNTPSQTGFNKKRREKNLRQAFGATKKGKEELKNSKILLVDDVTTTATTLNECARTLKENGAAEVRGLVIARGQ